MLFRAIRFLLSLTLLFGILYLGKLAAWLLPIGIPDSIWGMMILFVSLVIGVVKEGWVILSARPLTRYMTLFFIPICAEVIEHVDILASHLTSFVLANMLSTGISLVAIGLFAQWIFHRSGYSSHHQDTK